MNQPAFDTLRTTQQMEDAGIARAHAEAISHAFAEWGGKLASKDDIEDMATKDDLKGLATKEDITALQMTLAARQESVGRLWTVSMGLMSGMLVTLVSVIGFGIAILQAMPGS